MGLRRRSFIAGLTAFGLGGCKSPLWFGDAPRLKFGVISDIHITTPASAEAFRRALVYFRDRGADAVLVAGDLSDWGLKSGFRSVAETWYDVFPNDCGADGEKVVKLFITGNHDFDGWDYGDMTLDMHVQGYSEDEALSKHGMAKCWEEAFHEPFAEIRKRTVKGYDFVSAEWAGLEKSENDAKTAEWLAAHAGELSNDKPFFFFRHAPLPGTVSSSLGRPGVKTLTDALRKFPNCIAFNGHTHWTLNDERSIWQEEFTAISIPSMSYTTMPRGYENGSDSRKGDSKLGMPRLPSRDNLEEAQGYFVSVYEDRMVVERRDFEHMTEAATPWIVPLGANRAKPFAWTVRAMTAPVPQFAAGAEVDAFVTNADTRGGHWAIFMTLEFPAAECADGGRVFDYEVRAELVSGGAPAALKRFLSPAFYKRPEDEPSFLSFRFDAMDLPESGRYCFAVYPRNCFGVAGRPIHSRFFESKPGKSKAKPIKGNGCG